MNSDKQQMQINKYDWYKICQIIMFNKNSWLIFWKIYITLLTEFVISWKSSVFLYVVTSHIMLSDESENELFWNQIIFQNTREKNL